MRPIASLAMPEIERASITAVGPTFLDVEPGSLLVDEEYQRDLGAKSVALIQRIVAEWSWTAFKPPVVARVDDALHVIDGQHTAIAAVTHGGIATIPVMIVDAGEVEARAQAFVRHNRDRIAVTATELHFAMLAAGDEDALTISQVCNRAGVKILRMPPSFARFKRGDTMAINTIKGLVSRRHAMGARRVLEAAVKGGASPVSAGLIRAIERLLFEPEYAGEISADDIATVLIAGHDLDAESKRFAAEHKLPVWRALAAVIWMKRKRRRG